MLRIAIDGACRRNGKPDCVAAGGVFIVREEFYNLTTETLSCVEYNSTNQRGELKALILALRYIVDNNEKNSIIITDSEYLLNAINKEWIMKWAANNWILLSGDKVKNSDLWQEVYELLMRCTNNEIACFYIKGHVIPFGAVTASKLLATDTSGLTLYKEVLSKYDSSKATKADNIYKANSLSLKNNGFRLPDDKLRLFVAMNIVVDAVATEAVNTADCIA